MMTIPCTHTFGPSAAHDTALQRVNHHSGVHSSSSAQPHRESAAHLGVLHSMTMRATGQDAQADALSSERRRTTATASSRIAAQLGTEADTQQEQAATKSSQETARVAQALVSKASNQQREGDAVANRQGLVQSCPRLASTAIAGACASDSG